jgi:diguanylate cyclase (GGDEF)-like protein/PAS domain S-box-containing protein
MERAGLLRWIRACAQPTTYLGLTMIAAVWGAVLYMDNAERDGAYREALRRGHNLTRVFEEHIARVIRSADSALLVMRKLHEQSLSDPELAGWIKSANLQNEMMVQLTLASRDGIVEFSSLGPIRSRADVSDRPHFWGHVLSSADELIISPPVIGVTSGKWSIQLTRHLTAPDGSFDGVAGAALDPSKFERFYNSIDLGEHGIAALVGFDGIVRARGGNGTGDGDFIGRSIHQARMFKLYREQPHGTYWNTDGRLDGTNRLIFYRVVQGFPLIAAVGLSEIDIFAQASAQARNYANIGIVLTAIALIAMGVGAARELTLSSATAALQRSKKSLERTNMWFDAAIENMAHGLCMFDQEQRLIVCNRRYGEMYGLTREQTKPGTTLRSILQARVSAGNTPEDAEAYVERRLDEVCRPEAYYVVNELRDGRVYAISHQPMKDGGWVAIHEDVTAQRRAEAQIIQMARHDVLTELANRAVLLEKMEEALARQRRRGEGFSVLMLDLDLFKAVNDSLGHPVGDNLLKAAANRLLGCTRETDLVARLGGDEFAILQFGETNQREAAIVMANKLLEAIAAPYDIEGNHIVIGTSIGIALAPEHGTDSDRLMKNADLALYKVKAEGRNGYRFFEPAMGVAAQSRHAFEVDLRVALAQEQFDLRYQPIVDSATKEVTGVEALIRWNHPDKGIILPDDFIPIAEEIGLVIPIGEWVLRRACDDAAKWPSSVKVAVNLSPSQFRRGDLVDIVSNALRAAQLPPERLELEITESVLMERNAQNLGMLHQLRSLGVSIVLDDFGTGYASLSYLQMFRFDKIKIDRSFVKELSNRADCAAIVCAVTGLGRTLNVVTVAEGVETEDHFDLLRAAGCGQAQGYLFGLPCRATELSFGVLGNQVRKGKAA